MLTNPSTPYYDKRVKELHAHVRDVPDWPIEGILFKDLSPLMANPRTLLLVVNWMKAAVARCDVTDVVALEARGFPYGAALAYSIEAGFTALRKPGKLPGPVHREDYSLEYGTNTIEMQTTALQAGSRVVLVDDLLATGGTAAAAIDLVRRFDVTVVGFLFVMELPSLKGGKLLDDRGVPYCSLLDGETKRD